MNNFKKQNSMIYFIIRVLIDILSKKSIFYLFYFFNNF